MIDTASCNVAALPSWKYGAVSATLRKGAMRSTQRSSSRSVMGAADIVRALHLRAPGVPVAGVQHAVMAAAASGALADLARALPQRAERWRGAGAARRAWVSGARGLEGRPVPGLAQPLPRRLRREVHLHVRLDRPLRLLLERRRPAILELCGKERGVVDGGAVVRPRACVLADRDPPGI